MKRRVILDIEPGVVRAKQAIEANIYGFRVIDGEIYIVIKDDDRYITTHLYADDEVQNNIYEKGDLTALISEILEDGFTVFEFETKEEFAEWILGNQKTAAMDEG